MRQMIGRDGAQRLFWRQPVTMQETGGVEHQPKLGLPGRLDACAAAAEDVCFIEQIKSGVWARENPITSAKAAALAQGVDHRPRRCRRCCR
jgi:hypothetical protein